MVYFLALLVYYNCDNSIYLFVYFGSKTVALLCVLSQRVYDEEVEETIPKADALEKQPEQVNVAPNNTE